MESWSKAIEADMTTVHSTLEYAYKVNSEANSAGAAASSFVVPLGGIWSFPLLATAASPVGAFAFFRLHALFLLVSGLPEAEPVLH